MVQINSCIISLCTCEENWLEHLRRLLYNYIVLVLKKIKKKNLQVHFYPKISFKCHKAVGWSPLPFLFHQGTDPALKPEAGYIKTMGIFISKLYDKSCSTTQAYLRPELSGQLVWVQGQSTSVQGEEAVPLPKIILNYNNIYLTIPIITLQANIWWKYNLINCFKILI